MDNTWHHGRKDQWKKATPSELSDTYVGKCKLLDKAVFCVRPRRASGPLFCLGYAAVSSPAEARGCNGGPADVCPAAVRPHYPTCPITRGRHPRLFSRIFTHVCRKLCACWASPHPLPQAFPCVVSNEATADRLQRSVWYVACKTRCSGQAWP